MSLLKTHYSMKHRSSTKRHWILSAGLSILVAVHLLGFRYLLSHARLSSTVLATALLLVAIKNLGLLGPVMHCSAAATVVGSREVAATRRASDLIESCFVFRMNKPVWQ